MNEFFNKGQLLNSWGQNGLEISETYLFWQQTSYSYFWEFLLTTDLYFCVPGVEAVLVEHPMMISASA